MNLQNNITAIKGLSKAFTDAGLAFPLVVDQIAMVVRPEALESAKALMASMGHTEWVSDTNKAVGEVFGVPARVEGELHFSYSALNLKPGLETKGLEYEILVYNEPNLIPSDGGPVFDNWHARRHRLRGIGSAFRPAMEISHFGYHLPSENALEAVREVMLNAGFEIAQEVRTVSHSSPFLVETGRKYHYLIFDSRETLGADWKFISRVE